MSILKIVLFIFCCSVFSVSAGVINCEPSSPSDSYNSDEWSEVHVPFELKPSGVNITLGANIPDWTVLYTVSANIGMSASYCNVTTFMYYTILTQTPPIRKQGNDYIYSTNIPGIGMSVSSNLNGNASLQPYPVVIYYYTTTFNYGFWATIKFWKIAGQNIPMQNGPLTVTGPEAAVVYKNAGYSFTSSQPGRVTNDGLAYISSSRVLTGTLIFQTGTCNIVGNDIRVDMGTYDGAGGHSEWKNASFQLLCPNGFGYQGVTTSGDAYGSPFAVSDAGRTITANAQKNGRVRISIVPYTEIVDANKGIIALDGTGAQGYGIQLAWGDYSSQSSADPENPVLLGSYVDANTLNSGFRAGDTPIGGNAFTGTDNTIKMAARYIRTTGATAPGPANAVVQVIADYQ
ncbi:hypothetical protein V8N76_004003 [Salmonella enterica]